MKAKKREQRKAHETPDNPSNCIRRQVILDPRGILENPENWDERLWPCTSNTLDNMYNVCELNMSDSQTD